MSHLDNEHHYWAEAIEDGDTFYYHANVTILKISEDQFCKVVNNPFLYYLSKALKLHKRIERVKRGFLRTHRKFITDSVFLYLRKDVFQICDAAIRPRRSVYE